MILRTVDAVRLELGRPLDELEGVGELGGAPAGEDGVGDGVAQREPVARREPRVGEAEAERSRRAASWPPRARAATASPSARRRASSLRRFGRRCPFDRGAAGRGAGARRSRPCSRAGTSARSMSISLSGSSALMRAAMRSASRCCPSSVRTSSTACRMRALRGKRVAEIFQRHRALGLPVEATVELRKALGNFGHVAKLIGELADRFDGVGKPLFVGFVERQPEPRPPELRILRRWRAGADRARDRAGRSRGRWDPFRRRRRPWRATRPWRGRDRERAARG